MFAYFNCSTAQDTKNLKKLFHGNYNKFANLSNDKNRIYSFELVQRSAYEKRKLHLVKITMNFVSD